MDTCDVIILAKRNIKLHTNLLCALAPDDSE